MSGLDKKRNKSSDYTARVQTQCINKIKTNKKIYIITKRNPQILEFIINGYSKIPILYEEYIMDPLNAPNTAPNDKDKIKYLHRVVGGMINQCKV